MGNACQPFGYSIDEGMKAFCIGELCVGIFHLIMASVAFRQFDALNDAKGKLGTWYGLAMVLLIVLTIALIVQFVCGWLLYFLGFKKRNMTICLAWIVVACVNFTLSFLVLMCTVIEGNCEGKKESDGIGCLYQQFIWHSSFLYLLYVILGVWIIVVYMKWAKSTGVAVQYSTTPAGQSQSHRSAKVSNQDNEA